LKFEQDVCNLGVAAEVKACLMMKMSAFLQKDDCVLRVAKKELRSVICKCKLSYRDKLEEQLHDSDARNAWRGFRNMMGMNEKVKMVECPFMFPIPNLQMN